MLKLGSKKTKNNLGYEVEVALKFRLLTSRILIILFEDGTRLKDETIRLDTSS